MNKIIKWKDYKFVSSSMKTKEFTSFAKDYKQFIKDILPNGSELVSYNIGHFYISGFIKNNDKFVYFTTSDVRFNVNEWLNNILIRTAKNDKDFTGGSNCFTSLDKFKENMNRLLEQI